MVGLPALLAALAIWLAWRRRKGSLAVVTVLTGGYCTIFGMSFGGQLWTTFFFLLAASLAIRLPGRRVGNP